MRHRLAMKAFLSERGRGDVQRARAKVWTRWQRELTRLVRDTGGSAGLVSAVNPGFLDDAAAIRAAARPVVLPSLLRKQRARRRPNPDGSLPVLWTEVSVFADPRCRRCGGFGLLNRVFCICAVEGFLHTFTDRRIRHHNMDWAWRPGRELGAWQSDPRDYHLRILREVQGLVGAARIAETKRKLAGMPEAPFSASERNLHPVAIRAWAQHGADAEFYGEQVLKHQRAILALKLENAR